MVLWSREKKYKARRLLSSRWMTVWNKFRLLDLHLEGPGMHLSKNLFLWYLFFITVTIVIVNQGQKMKLHYVKSLERRSSNNRNCLHFFPDINISVIVSSISQQVLFLVNGFLVLLPTSLYCSSFVILEIECTWWYEAKNVDLEHALWSKTEYVFQLEKMTECSFILLSGFSDN